MVLPLKLQVRYGDLDLMGHVNNCIYLSYFEMARVYYFGELLGTSWDWEKKGVLVAKNEVEYLEPILLNDQPEITMWCETIGNKSFTLGYSIRTGNKLCTKGNTVMVCFDTSINKSIVIPDELVEALQKLKG